MSTSSAAARNCSGSTPPGATTTTTGFAALAERLHADADLGREHLPGDVAVALAGDFHRLLDRLAVADPRLVDADVQAEVAQQPVLDHLQVQFAHAADERLAGLLVFAGAEGRVLPLHHLQHVGQLLPLGGSLRLDGHRDDRFREGDRLQQDRLLGAAQRVAGDGMPQADDADDVAGRDRLDLLRRSAWMRHSCGTFSFLSLPGL